jgi:hypothetical protein
MYQGQHTMIFVIPRVALVVFTATIGIIGCSNGSEVATRKNGQLIVTALEAFRDDVGRPAATLAELSPKYLSKIPENNWGTKQWQYEVNSDGTFDFSFCGARGVPAHIYSSKSGKWMVDDG